MGGQRGEPQMGGMAPLAPLGAAPSADTPVTHTAYALDQ